MRTKVQPKKKTATKSTAAKRTTARNAKSAPKKATPTAEQTDKPAKPVAKPTAKKPAAKKTSALDAAAKVLAATDGMTTKEMIEATAEQEPLSSAGGKTPDRTLCSAILREIATRGKVARFMKTDRGRFALAAN